MKKKTIPITLLRDTGKVDSIVNSTDEPIFVTKNGYDDFVLLSKKAYERSEKEKVIEIDDPLGYVRVMCSNFDLTLGNVKENCKKIISCIEKAVKEEAHILLLPELCITGSSIGDLFFSQTINSEVEKSIDEIKYATKGKNIFVVAGFPIFHGNTLRNCAIVFEDGNVLGIVPKVNLTEEEQRYFSPYYGVSTIDINGNEYPFGNSLIFQNMNFPTLKIGIEIGTDILLPNSPSNMYGMSGASLILNPSTGVGSVDSAFDTETLIKSSSLKNQLAYCYCESNCSESTSSGINLGNIFNYENGVCISKQAKFDENVIITDIDIEIINNAKRRNNQSIRGEENKCLIIPFSQRLDAPTSLKRKVAKSPYLPQSKDLDTKFVNTIFSIQAHSLLRRLKAIGCKKVVLGLSGGLDSAAALIVCYEAFKIAGYDSKDIYAFSMPSFGTTTTTKSNSELLAEIAGVTFKEIPIAEAVKKHLEDIGLSDTKKDTAYENAQARERTQILMDVANEIGGIVVGTGDLSELALGWCTYNGDQMSMYSVNCGIPKTVLQYTVKGYGIMHPKFGKVLQSIVDTPISPELLPSDNDKIAQLTENLIGPYKLQDFYIYYYVKYGFGPRKLFNLASKAFKDEYSPLELKQWMKVFFKRFFVSQFKRSASPDGPKVFDIDVSSKGFLKMPSDLSAQFLIEEVDKL